MFVGKNKRTYQDYENDIQEFVENVYFPFTVCALCYIPGGILTGVTFVDFKKVYVQNTYPHLTMMTCKLPPVASNNLLHECFDEGKAFSKYYNREKIQTMEYPLKTNIFVGNEKRPAYLIPFKQIMLVEARTKIEH